MKTKLDVNELTRRNMMMGGLLKAIRNERGGAQRDYALKLGSSKPTFLCTVEKGTNSIPQASIYDYARVYMPEEKEKLSAAIVYYLLPEIWDVIVSSMPNLMKSQKTADEITSEVDTWLRSKFERYGITAV